MTYKTHSTHAPTGSAAAKFVVSPNEYAPEGRDVSYPTNFDIYVVKISDVDGSTQVNGEPHTVDQLLGSRLYLYHRPMVSPNGTIAQVTTSAGTINQDSTNAKQGYIEFSTAPTVDFTLTYLAASDCFTHWQQNTMQDSIMELQGQVGASNQTGWPGLRMVNAAIFDIPTDSLDGLLPNHVSMEHLPRSIRISSSNVDSLTGTLGDRQRIQLGRRADDLHFEGTGITIGSVDGYSPDDYADVWISNRTGDKVFCAGTFSGHDQMTIGGAGSLVAGYSGLSFTSASSGSYYTGAMLRVHGDMYCQGDMLAHGTLTLVTTTGETSTIFGDFTIRDELFVLGTSHLIGPTETNALHTFTDYTLDGNLIAGNKKGAGDRGHTLVDTLDCSEVERTYKTVTRKNIDNYVIKATKSLTHFPPKHHTYGGDYAISGQVTVGDVFGWTGFFTAAPSFSGDYPSILQLQWSSGTMPMVSGFFEQANTSGLVDGFISRGTLDPGSLWIEILAPSAAAGYRAPIFGYTIQETKAHYLTKLNVYTPQQPDQVVAANDNFLLYSPGCEHYDYVTSAGGSSPTVTINATSDDPIWIGFEDEVRTFTANSSATSLTAALNRSVTGQTPGTGIAYVFASMKNIDIEAEPTVVVRGAPWGMPWETIMGEVIAQSSAGGSWTVLETTSYRPGGLYDSAWIPVFSGEGATTVQTTASGRVVSSIRNLGAPSPQSGNRLYFHHNLGADLCFKDVNATLHLASYAPDHSSEIHPSNYRANVHTLWGQDIRNPIPGASGAYSSIGLGHTNNAASPEANVFYMDGKVIGIQIHDDTMNNPTEGVGPFDYLRLVIKRTS